jgi:nucleotide-binding universal stress UspA family protein
MPRWPQHMAAVLGLTLFILASADAHTASAFLDPPPLTIETFSHTSYAALDSDHRDGARREPELGVNEHGTLIARTHRPDREQNSWSEPMMIKTILCAIDRSPSSLQAFSYALALARWQRARLNLLEVIEEAPPPGVTRVRKSDGLPHETRTALERDLRQVLTARRASDVKVEVSLRKGKVAQEILAQAKTSRADLVVIGSHGRGGVQRLVLGSVAERVLRLATCPVLTVRRGVRLVRRNRSPFETILCPTDFSVAANKALAYAKRLAEEAEAKLIVMTAVERPFGEVRTGPIAELQKSIESSASDALTRLLPRPASHAPRAQAIVAVGKASAATVKVARARSVDLIVMGVSGRGALDVALLGSTTHHVIREGAWPVLTVRTGTR